MTRARVTEEQLQQRLAEALAITDRAERRKAANKARNAIYSLQLRSTLANGERHRIQSR